ncbi:MAG TPA: alpha/beta hydrolase, partial [Chloroflexi bacterium]|nr:alpha/beta hydrolase [Chloroflexota bacterium]
DPQTVESLRAFRETYPPRQIEVDGVTWEYVALGQGEEAILFLHGMSGAYDIWWQVMEALQDRYRVISVTYPAVDTLEGLSRGVLAILDEEGVDRVTVVGSSLGGYLAQYLVATHPERIERAVFANTFPPNDLIIERTRTIGKLLPFLPEWLVMRTLRSSILNDVYPAASGNAELVRAYLLEQAYGAMSKAQFVARYRCVVEPFTPPDVEALGIPVLIIEASNDPLVEEALRDQLRETYPTATVYQLEGVGHFPYLNEPEKYLRGLEDFLPE